MLQEKIATENGEVIADEGYDGLSKVIVAVEGETVETWDGTGIVIAPIEEEPTTFTFTIGDMEYEAEEGMTWYEWVGSDYSPDSYNCTSTESNVCPTGETYVADSEGNAVIGSTVIIEGGVYSIEEVATEDALAGTWVWNRTLQFITEPSSTTTESAYAKMTGTYYGLDSAGELKSLPLSSIALKFYYTFGTHRFRLSLSNSENLINGTGGEGSCTTYYISETGTFDVWESYYGVLSGDGFVETDSDHNAIVSENVLTRTASITTTYDELEFTTVLPGQSQESMKSLLLTWLQANATKQ